MAQEHEDNANRVSLEGLDPEEALRALLAVDPESEPVDDQGERPEEPPPGEAPGR
ncbi:MAG: hypothetical protein M3406_12545 [Chloroflexota bacterium]|nr:hypothetical protein [Chloroflexota bacterium]